MLSTEGAISVGDGATGRGLPVSRRTFPRPVTIAAATAADGRPVLAVNDGEAANLWDVQADAPFAAPLTGPVGYAHIVADGPGTLITTTATDNAVAI